MIRPAVSPNVMRQFLMQKKKKKALPGVDMARDQVTRQTPMMQRYIARRAR